MFPQGAPEGRGAGRYAVRRSERWQSGRMRRSRKPLRVVRLVEGSNPSLSAPRPGATLAGYGGRGGEGAASPFELRRPEAGSGAVEGVCSRGGCVAPRLSLTSLRRLSWRIRFPQAVTFPLAPTAVPSAATRSRWAPPAIYHLAFVRARRVQHDQRRRQRERSVSRPLAHARVCREKLARRIWRRHGSRHRTSCSSSRGQPTTVAAARLPRRVAGTTGG